MTDCPRATAEAALGGSKPTAAALAAPPAAAAAAAATLRGDGQQRQDDLPQPVPGDDPAHEAWSAVSAGMYVCVQKS